MKRKIIVTINADEKTCGKCDWRVGTFCHLFGEHVSASHQGDGRAKCCLAAERKAKEAKP